MPNQTEIDNLIKCIVENYNITKEQLFGVSRVAHIAEARQVFCYCLRKKFQFSFPVIGEMLNRDHTTILHSCVKIGQEILVNEKIKRIVNQCIAKQTKFFDDEPEIVDSVNEADFKQDQLLKYVKDKYEQEQIEYEQGIEKLKNEKVESLKKIKEDFETRLNSINENKRNQDIEYKEALKNIRNGKHILAESYLSPKKELLEKHNLNDKIKIFLPKYKTNCNLIDLPVQYSDEYLRVIFDNLEERNREFILKRYGFFENDFHTLERLAENTNITRERVRQLISASLNKIYYNNNGGTRQILEEISKKIVKENLILIDDLVDEYFICDKSQKNNVIKFILVIITLVKWIKKFEFSGNIYLINYHNEEFIFNSIDKVKQLIKQIYENMPDLIEDKWEYVYKNLLMFEFFKDNPNFARKDFIRTCYDNYLFESEIVIRKNDDFKKYKIEDNNKESEKTKGVPNEYEVFFK